jgi:hypothetical protein
MEQIVTLITTYWLKRSVRLKKITRFQKGKPRLDLEKLHGQQHEVQYAQEEKFGTIQCESGKLERIIL